MRIFTIGIGTAEGELLRIKDAQGGSDYIRDEQGNVVKSHLNETALAADRRRDRRRLLPAAARGQSHRHALRPGAWPNCPSPSTRRNSCASITSGIIGRWRWRLCCCWWKCSSRNANGSRKPNRRQRRPLKQRVRAAATVLLLLLLPTALRGSPSSALREYKAGKYDQALKEYEQLLKRKSDDPRLHFNAGAAAYRNQQFEEAAKQFNATLASAGFETPGAGLLQRGQRPLPPRGEESRPEEDARRPGRKRSRITRARLKLNPQDADAKYNYEFVKRKLEELKQQQQQKPEPNKIEPSEAAKKAKAEADEAVRRRDYSKALGIMEKQLEQDPTTRYYADYIQRLKEVDGVQESTKH